MRWLLSKMRTRKSDDSPSAPEAEPARFYTIDFDPLIGRFNALFCHGTSSNHMDSIMREGLVMPNFASVLDTVLASRPDLLAHRDVLKVEMGVGALGVEARRDESGEFATWLANRVGIQILADEIGKIVQHGGEVYRVTWSRLSKVINARRMGELPARFPTATPRVLLFKVPFDIPMTNEETPRTHDNYIVELAQGLVDDSADPSLIREVRFLEPLTPERIFWHGSMEQALDAIQMAPLSPLAQAELRSRISRTPIA